MIFRTRSCKWFRTTALICVAALAPGDISLIAQQAAAPAPGTDAPKSKTPDQLDSIVAPIALYPDPLLGQVLAASTYPLEIVQAQRWLKENSKLTGENLTKAAAKQPWDPSVQALVAFPAALKFLDDNLQWTTDLGNVFLDQQSDVMNAVQRMRKKAKDGGKLETTKEQKVEVKTIESKTIIEIQPANPQVIYVPSYNPVVVYGPPVYAYPYPPVVYPAYGWGTVAATAAISFGVGVAMGAFWGGCCGAGGWGWNTGWGGNNVVINNNFNNRYGYANSNRNTNINGGNRNNIGNGNSNWSHNSNHRRSVPYSNAGTARQFGGTARDSSGRTQRFDGRSNQGLGGGRDGGGLNRGGSGGGGRMQSERGGGGGDRIGNRSIDSGSRSNSALGGASSRSQSQASSNLGFSSSRQSGGGGFSGGGSRGGGSRGGGGGRRR